MISLFCEKKQCCGCGACYNSCPKGAIDMVEDSYGFIYPKINASLCISCGLCQKVCAYQKDKENANIPLKIYAAGRKDKNKIMKSASGGIFASFAEKMIRLSGRVYGVAWSIENGKIIPEHIGIEKNEQIKNLLGSKYVQSNTAMIYNEVKNDLLSGRRVLFSGTPCQVDALRCFLGRQYDNLITIDLICHGVPNQAFFNGYINLLEKKYKGKIVEFNFRDKKRGWGLNESIKILKNNKIISKEFSVDESSYYHMFLNAQNYRENCYYCKYANEKRVGDITIGDFWGIEEEKPYLLKQNGGLLDISKGISVILVNTQQGNKWLEQCKDDMYLFPATLIQAAKNNTQLRMPTSPGRYRNIIMGLYKNGGYEQVHTYYKRRILIPMRVKKNIKKIIPKFIKTEVKKFLKSDKE